MKIIIDKTIVY